MVPIYFLFIILAITVLTTVVLLNINRTKVNVLKSKIEDLVQQEQAMQALVNQQNSDIEILKADILTERVQKDVITQSFTEYKANNETELKTLNQTLSDYRIKYEGVLHIEEVIKLKQTEFAASNSALEDLNKKYVQAIEIYKTLKDETILYQNDLEISKFGLYKPQYDYFTSEEYKQKIEYNYLKQRECIKADRACISNTEWSINGSKTEGQKLNNLYKKLMLFAFNGESDALIAKLKWNTATKTIERLNKSFDAINKLGAVSNVELTREFLNLKLAELALTHEYENKKQDEKEEQRRIREVMREEERSLREYEIAHKEAEEEERRYQKALKRVKEDLRYASREEVEDLNTKLFELETKLKETEQKKERALSMAQQTKSGHIYIISNIGSFGEDIYKIGMTRRLEPLDRVKELSDAAVPFRYDVHAVIFSDNAPKLEHDLHKFFHSRRVNGVNRRKEFFKVSLDEISNYVKENTKAEIEFTLLAEAKEYRETLSMIESILQFEQDNDTKVEKFPATLI